MLVGRPAGGPVTGAADVISCIMLPSARMLPDARCPLLLPAQQRQSARRCLQPIKNPLRVRRSSRAQVSTAASAGSELLVAIQSPPVRDLCATAFAVVGAFTWVKMFDKLTEAGIIDQKLSRKLVHLSAGPLFVLLWPLFSAEPYARYLAAIVPCLNALRLLCVGTGLVDSKSMIRTVSREGDRTELLRGPLYYALILCGITCFYWRESAVGLVALSLMCGGDGLADIVGRRLGPGNPLPHNPSKSWAGSAAMLAGGFSMAMALIAYFVRLGYLDTDLWSMAAAVGVVSLVATVMESLPVNKDVDDNLSVPGVALIMGVFLVRTAELL